MTGTSPDDVQVTEKATCLTVTRGNQILGSFTGPDAGAHAVIFSNALKASVALSGATVEPFGTLIRRSDGTEEFRRTGEAHSPTVLAYTSQALYAHPPITDWLPMDSAPRDATIIRLLVEFEEHSLEDSNDPVQTIGHNNFDNDGLDNWTFAGWCWTHDHYTQGVGRPIAWAPFAIDVPMSLLDHLEVVAGREGKQWGDVEKLITDEMLRLTALMKRDRGDGRGAIMPIWTSLNVIRHRIQSGRRAVSRASLPGGEG